MTRGGAVVDDKGEGQRWMTRGAAVVADYVEWSVILGRHSRGIGTNQLNVQPTKGRVSGASPILEFQRQFMTLGDVQCVLLRWVVILLLELNSCG